MEPRPAKLPDLSKIRAAPIIGYSLEEAGLTMHLWIERDLFESGLVRVFTAETDDEVAALVVPTPPKYRTGWVGTCSDEDIAADVSAVTARLATPLGGRRLFDGKTGVTIPALPQWILDRRADDPPWMKGLRTPPAGVVGLEGATADEVASMMRAI